MDSGNWPLILLLGDRIVLHSVIAFLEERDRIDNNQQAGGKCRAGGTELSARRRADSAGIRETVDS